MRAILFIGLMLIAFLGKAQEVTINENKFEVNGNQIWFNGINTPWHKFCDFGHPNFDYAWWTEEFEKYPENNINLARVWIHMSGEQSPEINTEGEITGVSEAFWEHMDHLFKIATDNEVYILPALLSFDIAKDSHSLYESWRAFIQDPANIQTYIDVVLIPMMARYENEPYLLAWEICNEPEWIFENEDCGPQTWQDVQVMHAMFAAAVHENSDKMVTTGSAAPKWNSPRYDSWGDAAGNLYSDDALSSAISNDMAYLDFYQYHWYAWQTEYLDSPFTKTTEFYQVDDKPVLVGETEGNDVCDDFICQTLSEMYESAYVNGFDGVCAWKTPQNDGHGTFENIAVATNSFYNDHPGLVYPLQISIDENESANNKIGISIYPNPAVNKIAYLNFSDNKQDYKLRISNTNGAIVKQFEVKACSKYKLDLEGINAGVYLLHIKSQIDSITKKLIIQ